MNPLFDDYSMHRNYTLEGLARKCPSCGVIAHYKVKGKLEKLIRCVECDYEFKAKKYNQGERPHAISIQTI
jgi:uncharacterized protein (DUF983 family)